MIVQSPSPIAIVTGGSAGIAESIVEQLAGEGYTVVVAARDRDKAAASRRKLLAKTGADADNLVFYPTDVWHRSDIEQLLEDTLTRYGRIDAFISCVCNLPFKYFKPPQALSSDDRADIHRIVAAPTNNAFDYLYRLSPRQPLNTTFVFLSSSFAGKKAFLPIYEQYGEAKRAVEEHLINKTRLGKNGITATIVRPGLTKTDGLLSHFRSLAQQYHKSPLQIEQQFLQYLHSQNPMADYTDPRAVSEIVALVLRYRMNFNGCVLPVNGSTPQWGEWTFHQRREPADALTGEAPDGSGS